MSWLKVRAKVSVDECRGWRWLKLLPARIAALHGGITVSNGLLPGQRRRMPWLAV